MKDYTEVAKQIRSALELGLKACARVQDGGSFSADRVMIPTGKDCPIQRKNKAFEAALAFVGVGFSFSNTSRWKGYVLEFPGATGQAARHLVACEEAVKHLRELGAYVHYRMD